MDLGMANYLMISSGLAVIALAVAATVFAQMKQMRDRMVRLEMQVEDLRDALEDRAESTAP